MGARKSLIRGGALCAAAATLLFAYSWLTGALDGPQNALINDELPFYSSADMRPRWDRWSSWQQTENFTLVDQGARSFDQDWLEHRPTIVGFFFAGCVSVCPISVEMLRYFETLQGEVPMSSRHQLLLLTITPEFDTSDVLSLYAQRLQLPPNWVLATGQPREIHRLVKSLFSDIAIPTNGVEPPHMMRVFLLDQQRRIRGVYDGSSMTEMRRMFGDYGRLQRHAGVASSPPGAVH